MGRYLSFVLCYMMFMLLVCQEASYAQVIVTPATGGTCLNVTPGAYSTLGDISILEINSGDITAGTNVTLILSAPSGFEFLAGTGSAGFQTGRNITGISSTVVTASTITVTFSCIGTNKVDQLYIQNIQARGLSGGAAGNILRTGGTATINGDASGGGINHGSLTSSGTGTLATTIAAGNWSSPAIWSTGTVPACNQNVSIGHTVTLDMVSTNANLTITTGGNLIATNAITVTGTFTITGTGTYTHDNAGNASTTVFAGTESFSSTSNLVFNQWYNTAVPLGSMVSSTYGNITFNVAGTWDQDGYFAPARVLGNISISDGTIQMDDGTGMSTSLTLQDVTISGSGNLTVCSGANRNMTLVTGDFTDNGTGATLTSIMNNVTGSLNWTVNGSISLNDNFSLMENCGNVTSVILNVTGSLDIAGGNIDFMNATNGPFTYTVTGRTTVSGSAGIVSVVNSGSGALVFNTGSLEISAGTTNDLINGSFSGTNQFNITGNLEVSGATTTMRFINIGSYASALNLDVGNDILITDADVYFVNSNDAVNIDCGRHMTVSGTTSNVEIQTTGSNTSLTDITIAGSFTLSNNATFYLSRGAGNVSLDVAETFVLSNGYYYGISHATAPCAPVAYFSFQDFDFNGGTLSLFDVKTSANTSVTVNCINNFNVNWLSNTDWVELVSYDGTNDASLNLTIGGDFSVTGNYTGAYFLSSQAGGVEAVTINGSLSVSGGTVMFVCDNLHTSGVDAHNITTSIGADMNITGGTTYLSTRDGNATITVAGDLNLSSGILNLKWLSGIATLTVTGAYYQTGGTFNMHSNTAATNDTCRVTVYGDFTQTSGIFNFDNTAGGAMAEHKLTLYSPNCTLGGTAVITHANNLTTNYKFGLMYFARSGTTVFSRTSSTHNIQHVRQTINSGTTVNASASSNGFQITTTAASAVVNNTSLYLYGTLDMGSNVLIGRQQANYYARMIIYNGGRYRTSHTGGFYSGVSATASSVNGFISGNNRLNFFLDASSVVEYYGTATSVVTGVPNGIANTVNHRYGILQINFTGTAGSTWVYPETTDEVHVRTTLVLTAGEFNLDSDHSTASGGRAINIDNGGTITRTSGFIRSETEDGSGVLRWSISANGSYLIPFGYDATNYIPFTYQQTAGASGIVSIGTYRSAANNTPYPPTVTHVHDVFGVDNSAFTVDRFWNLAVPGTATASMTYSFVASEGSGIVSPRAQLWEPVSKGWFPPSASQSNPTAVTTLAGGITAFNTWWTLSAASSPLPIDLVEFSAERKGSSVEMNWITQTEINNDYFTIERSQDGILFEPINQIEGAGNSHSPKYYQASDENPMKGRNYYRLKQTDFNGNYTYSKTEFVDFGMQDEFSVFPNPVRQNGRLNIVIPANGAYRVEITDVMGRLLYSNFIEGTKGEIFTLDCNDIGLKTSLANVRITSDSDHFSYRLVVTR